MPRLTIKEDTEAAALLTTQPMPTGTVPPAVGELITFTFNSAPTTRTVARINHNTTVPGWEIVLYVSTAPVVLALDTEERPRK